MKPLPPTPELRTKPTTLWGVAARRFANGYEFKGQGWTVLLYDAAEPVFCDEWVWQLNLPRCQLASVGRAYLTATGARNALIRAVTRLGLHLPNPARGGGKGKR